MKPNRLAVARRAAGFSLIELLVAVAIGMVLTMAITGLMVRSEAGRRSLTTVNDVSMNGAYLSYTLDRTLRNAGSGYTQSWPAAYGCRLLASRSGAQILPRTTAFPAPFASVPQTVRLAPVIVHAGAGNDGSDVLAVMSGASALGEQPMPVQAGSVTGTLLRLPATVGLRAGDLSMVLQDQTNCMLQQVAAGFAGGASQQLDFGGTYAANTINSVNLDSFGVSAPAFLAPIGNVAGNQPAFQLLGLDTNTRLASLDLLRLDGTDTATPIADGVLDLRALYGVDGDNDGRVDTWVSPATAPWNAATLQDGSVVSRDNLSRILAVRVGLILRNNVPERDAVSPASLVLFSDLASTLQVTRTLSADEQQLRYRTLEFTVPLRNVMMKPPL
jgi:type IV pilus assembly protein PilW